MPLHYIYNKSVESLYSKEDLSSLSLINNDDDDDGDDDDETSGESVALA